MTARIPLPVLVAGALLGALATGARALDGTLEATPPSAVRFDPAVRADLASHYRERARSLDAILQALATGAGELDEATLETLLRVPPVQNRLELAFERQYFAAREALVLRRERERQRRLDAARAGGTSLRRPGPGATEVTDGAQRGGPDGTGTTGAGADSRAAEHPPIDPSRIRDSRHPRALADLLFTMERFEEARIAYESVPPDGAGPRPEWVLYRIAICHWREGDGDAATAAFDAMLAAYPEGSFAALATLGKGMIELEPWRGARSGGTSGPDPGSGEEGR